MRPWTRRDAVALTLTLGLAALLRVWTFALPHDRGDQLVFAGVAAHVATRGAAGYTLRGLDYRAEPLGAGATLVRFAPGEGEGRLLQQFKRGGESFWDAPLASQPPVFVLALLASHAALGTAGDGFPLLGCDQGALLQAVRTDRAGEREKLERLPASERQAALAALGDRLKLDLEEREAALARALVSHPPGGAARAQLWATLPQVLVDLATTALLFVLGRRRGRLVGALAALAFAGDPLAVFAANRVLANGLLTLLALAALAAGEEEDATRRGARALLAGVLGGLATLTKVSGVFVLPALLLARRLQRGRFAASDAWLAAAHLGLAVPWWLYRVAVLGNPFAYDTVTQSGAAASFWAERTTGRTPLYYLAGFGRSPLAAVGVVTAVGLGASAFAAWRRGERAAPGLAHSLFALAVLGSAAVFPGKEARHLLLAYPSLFLLGGAAVADLASRLDVRGRTALFGVVALALGLEARHALALVFDVARMP